ncbi:phage portal protein [Streptomyces cylindrosporus]|uniref:Phage portal protein n=1 Tax=Streptomyces cylindrosporus TaxID=2927583 RepID=A0ABS9YK64_9ACTN|nr:phage portal protein [Streptomyces cylindrosporus]MCI3277647.1 phage portal protein [Streptomyces cylindrosporus]
MGLRSRFTQLAKVFGNREPADMQAGEAAAGMTPSKPFSPGAPIGPYDGFSRHPRTHDFVTGYNISARPRSHSAVAFDTLRGMIDAYDVAQMCIWHRIDSIRALDWALVPKQGFKGDASEAIALGMQVLHKPDRQNLFPTWLAKWLYDVLAYDAGALSRVKNRRGDVIGLKVVDGTTIAPLLDYWGDSPEPPAEAYVQYVNGLPWNWLTRNDLVYAPFRPRSNSPYGYAPLESILLNANTDLRFQTYFLQRFTEGNIPQAIGSSPENWTPDQVQQFQGWWDQFMMGDQSIKSQIRWIPGGSKIEWSNEKDFDDTFSLFLMRKTCAAYHVVPADLGFTETVNRSSGETQADVQHRVGDLPLVTHLQGVLTAFLQHDLHLPLDFRFDTGQEKEDRLTLAQAWQIYIDAGMASADEGRKELLGLPVDPRRPVPRFHNTPRLGPVPLLAIEGIAGKIDPLTYGPAEDQLPLPQPFVPAPGVISDAGTSDAKAANTAEDGYQTLVREASQHQAVDAAAEAAQMSKDGAATAGITAQTGLVGYDLLDHDEHQEESEEPGQEAELAKQELAAFRRFRQARRRSKVWRDFEFRHVDRVRAHRLNDAGRLAVRKDTGQIAAAGLAVRAADTGRVLMLQRALAPDDPAGGAWEFPGGGIEEGEKPLAAAVREWGEETGLILPYAPEAAAAHAFDNGPMWTHGIYQGFVYTIDAEDMLDLGYRDAVTNPDDPDGDQVESIAWWDPAQLAGNPAVRRELQDSLGTVLPLLAVCPCCDGGGEHSNGSECLHCDASGTSIGASGPMPCEGALEGTADVTVTPDGVYTSTCPCGTPAVYDDLDGWQHADGSIGHDEDLESVADKMRAIAKAAGGRPKGGGAEGENMAARWPGWKVDLKAIAYWTPRLARALSAAVDSHQLAEGWLSVAVQPSASTKRERIRLLGAQARAWLAAHDPGLAAALESTLHGVYTDGYLIGTVAARVAIAEAGVSVAGASSLTTGFGEWTPGDTKAAQLLLGRTGDGAGLRQLLDDSGITIRSIADTRLNALGRILARAAERGDAPTTIAAAIEDLLSNPSRAEMIATTELCRAVSKASLGTYLANGIEAVEWVSAGDGRVCNICATNEEAGPRRPGNLFPNGRSSPPGHPWCRCALTPVTGAG